MKIKVNYVDNCVKLEMMKVQDYDYFFKTGEERKMIVNVGGRHLPF